MWHLNIVRVNLLSLSLSHRVTYTPSVLLLRQKLPVILSIFLVLISQLWASSNIYPKCLAQYRIDSLMAVVILIADSSEFRIRPWSAEVFFVTLTLPVYGLFSFIPNYLQHLSLVIREMDRPLISAFLTWSTLTTKYEGLS